MKDPWKCTGAKTADIEGPRRGTPDIINIEGKDEGIIRILEFVTQVHEHLEQNRTRLVDEKADSKEVHFWFSGIWATWAENDEMVIDITVWREGEGGKTAKEFWEEREVLGWW